MTKARRRRGSRAKPHARERQRTYMGVAGCHHNKNLGEVLTYRQGDSALTICRNLSEVFLYGGSRRPHVRRMRRRAWGYAQLAHRRCAHLLHPENPRFFNRLLQLSLTFVNFAIADRYAEARSWDHAGGAADIIDSVFT